MPTFAEKISIDYDAFLGDRDNEYSKILRQVNNTGAGYVRTAVLNDNEGMYVVDLNSVKDLNSVDIDVLKAGLNGEKIAGVYLSIDRKLAFAPYETIICGDQPYKDLPKNGGIIALARDMSQVEKLVKVAEKFHFNPYFFALEAQRHIERKFVSLGSGWVGSLVVDCDCLGDVADGFASGVNKTGEATQKIE